jgi:hypothetical protein
MPAGAAPDVHAPLTVPPSEWASLYHVAQARFAVFVRPGATSLGWRFLAANNRDVAHSPGDFAGLAACLAAARELRDHVADAVPVSTRVGRAEWVWRLRLDTVEVAVSSRTYGRRLQCEAACALFVSLVPEAGPIGWKCVPRTGRRFPASPLVGHGSHGIDR